MRRLSFSFLLALLTAGVLGANTISSFTASPTSFASTPTTITLTWAGCASTVTVYNATDHIYLKNNVAPASGSVTDSASHSIAYQAWCDNSNATVITAQALLSGQKPAVDSVTPTSGNAYYGTWTIFTVQMDDPVGAAFLDQQQVLINTTQVAANGCMFVPIVINNGLNLYNSDGTTVVSGVIGSGGILTSTGQCDIDLNNTTVTKSGKTVTTVVPVRFKSTFTGTRKIWALAFDSDVGNSGWLQTGTITVVQPTHPQLIVIQSKNQNNSKEPNL